jgi:hypothetical protein
MNLANPVSITPPSRTKRDGTTKTFTTVEIDSLGITIIDDVVRRIARVSLMGRKDGRPVRSFPKPLTLWEGEAYDEAGDYTQAQVEARVAELLGSDASASLTGMMQLPVSV